MKKVFLLVFLICISGILPSVSSGKELPKIAVWDLTAGDINPSYAQDLTSILVSEISKLKIYEVYSQENVRTLAGWTAERMQLGCTDTKCLTALGQMDIAKLISGRVGKIGNRYSVSLNLFDTQNARAENSVSEFGGSEDELIGLVQGAVRKLLGSEIPLSELRTRQAIKDLDRAIELNPKDARAYFIRADKYRELGDYRQAIQDLDRAIALDPKYALAYILRGLVFSMLRDYRQAIKDYDRAIELDPKSETAYGMRGSVYGQKGQADRAIQDFNKAIELSPNNALAYRSRGIAYSQRGQADRAIQDFNKAIELDPKNGMVYAVRACAYSQKGQADRVIQDCNKAIELDLKNGTVYGNCAIAYYNLKEYQQALDYFSRSIELNPKNMFAYATRGRAYARLGNYQQAANDLDKAISMEPDSPRICFSMSCFYSIQKKADQACFYLRKSIEKGYENWDWIKKDIDLDNIRNEECYKQIIVGK